MPTKFVCLDPYDTFTSTDADTARRHVADNPGHKVVDVDEDYTGDVDAKTIEIKEEPVEKEPY